jgi:hypothetical protein
MIAPVAGRPEYPGQHSDSGAKAPEIGAATTVRGPIS